jgi:hypothetical protein
MFLGFSCHLSTFVVAADFALFVNMVEIQVMMKLIILHTYNSVDRFI